MEWYRQVQFIAAVPMPQDIADGHGTTVNGMWAGPELRSEEAVADAHGKGQWVLFSVPLIALTPKVYERDECSHLLDEVCADIDGNQARVPWYYWEDKPVYSVCIYSPVFREYLLDRCREGIGRGADVVNLDEINTSIGLMDRRPGSSGFCRFCLERFRAHVVEEGTAERVAIGETDDATLRRRLRDEDALYGRYRRFQEREAFAVVTGFIEDLRTYAGTRNPSFAITANLAYLGNNVSTHGDLWGPMWGQYVDFVMMENDYRVEPDGRHALLPRGKFTAWYRLGSAFSSRTPTWICPSIMVPRQLAGEERTQYYLLMFLEAYANGGRWGYYWWPGVDVEARLKATVPPQLKDWIRFITEHREYYELATTRNELAILYLDGSISREPEAHDKYLGLAQALAEAGYQFDVLYAGDGVYASDALDPTRLARYRALLIPEAGHITLSQTEALTDYALGTGGEVVVFSPSSLDAQLTREEHGAPLRAFRKDYRPDDRERIVASVDRFGSSRVRISDPSVNVIRYSMGEELVLHLVNYAYDVAYDRVTPSPPLRLTLPWEPGREAACILHGLEGEQKLECRFEDGELTMEIPELQLYGLVVVR